jgi:hypothetical protein
MSDFFANVGGFRMPDVRMNQGPLPSVAGGPVGTDGTPDGVINGTSRLLSGVTPYAYGESARMGSDSNYQQVPHRVQYIVPPLYLPSWDSTTTHRVCHAVDNGDLAFVLMTRGRQWFAAGDTVMNSGPGTLPLFGNLEVVNYILACLQIAPTRAALAAAGGHGAGAAGKRSWTKIREHLWKGMFEDAQWLEEEDYPEHMFRHALYTVRNMLKPHGVCAGSEYQGGQHEESWAPVQAAVNYTTTMTVDGQNRDLVNYWHERNVHAGDRLILRLVLVPKREQEQTREFQLTSYHERPVSAAVTTARAYWQLQPWVLHCETEEPEGRFVAERAGAKFDYRVTGYWHIAQSFQGRQGCRMRRAISSGAPLQVTFAPVFVQHGDDGDLEWAWIELLERFERGLLVMMADAVRNTPAHLGDINHLNDALTASDVRASTFQKIFGSRVWEVMSVNIRVVCFSLIATLYQFADEIGSDGLKLRVLREIPEIERKAVDWETKDATSLEPEIQEFHRKVVQGKLDDFNAFIRENRLDPFDANECDDVQAGQDAEQEADYSGFPFDSTVFHGLRANLGGAEGAEGAVGAVGACAGAEGAGGAAAPKKKKRAVSALEKDAASPTAARE